MTLPYTLHLGDCLEVLRTVPDNSIDSVVTDPPYGLAFMGKRWDYDVPSVDVWAECLRVLKPGGHLLAFAGTLVKQEAGKVRQRHTLEGVQKILSANTTPDWLKRAIRLALLSLQRREDLVTWERSAVDMAKNTIRISTGKTENYAVPIHLEIEMGADLRQVVAECLSTPIASPYLLCYMPKRRRRDQMEAKLHWSAVTDDYLSKQFTKARDDCGAYDHIANKLARPTVHELRALGSWLYEKQGFPTEYVQALMGHADGEMTTYYQEGHEEKAIEYQRVRADLKL